MFPIILKEHNPEYKNWYEEEKASLLENFSNIILRINHIGSTSVENLMAKPTVDILMEISKDSNVEEIKDKLISMGWLLMHSSKEPEFRQVYNERRYACKPCIFY